VQQRLADLQASIAAVLAQAKQGVLLRDGMNVVIAGPPNAGKSSLLNRLAGHEAAIVTHIPGTTRDPLREYLSLDGLPVSIVDTAGLRETHDPVEVEGVRRARHELGRADHALWVMDGVEGVDAALDAAAGALPEDLSRTVVLNKLDLTGHSAETFERGGIACVRLSALTGEGVPALVQHLKTLAGWSSEIPGAFSARRRHLDALERATSSVALALDALLPEQLEIAAEELRGAQTALGELTGELTSDDLLGEIFARFCIGK
jgi:tRNA modification GTPase